MIKKDDNFQRLRQINNLENFFTDSGCKISQTKTNSDPNGRLEFCNGRSRYPFLSHTQKQGRRKTRIKRTTDEHLPKIATALASDKYNCSKRDKSVTWTTLTLSLREVF